MIVIAACGFHSPRFLKWTAPLRYLGVISYGIYLWHSVVIISLQPVFNGRIRHSLFWTLGLTILRAAGSWHLLEKPFLERFRKRYRRDRVQAV